MQAKSSNRWAALLAGLATVPMALGNAAPAAAAGTFKATDHNWVVAVNAAKLAHVPSGGTFKYCSTSDISAITPDVSYSGAPVGRTYKEKVIGPAAAGTITISAVHNVDGDVTPLKFTTSRGVWDNTYAIMSFSGSVGHSTLPPGTYSFVVLVGGVQKARTAVTLNDHGSC
jgi:hypothetical protein